MSHFASIKTVSIIVSKRVMGMVELSLLCDCCVFLVEKHGRRGGERSRDGIVAVTAITWEG